VAATVCPACGKPAVLVSSRRTGETYLPELGAWVPVVERRIKCPAPAGCSVGDEVYVVIRVDLLRGVSSKRTVSYERRTCAQLRVGTLDEE
jgi:hypothetical protein